MSTRFIIPLLVAGALAFAIGPRTNTEAASTPAATAAKASTPRRAAAPRKTTIDPTLAVVRGADGAVRVVLQVANATDRALELSFPTGKTHDVVVLDERGREVWRWSEGRLFTTALQTKTLGGGDTATFDEAWRPRGAHGRYVAVATLESSNFPVEQRTEFVIP